MTNFRLSIGAWGERLAEREYLKRGYVLVARNVSNKKGKRLGEIDLIVRSETEIIYVEVKTRTSDRFGSAVESITKAKKQRIVRAVLWFTRTFKQYQRLKPRIDVCAINIDGKIVNFIIIPYAISLES